MDPGVSKMLRLSSNKPNFSIKQTLAESNLF